MFCYVCHGLGNKRRISILGWLDECSVMSGFFFEIDEKNDNGFLFIRV